MAKRSTSLTNQVTTYLKELLKNGPQPLLVVRTLIENQFDANADALEIFKDLTTEALLRGDSSTAEGLRIETAADVLLRWQEKVTKATRAAVEKFLIELLEANGRRVDYDVAERAIRREFSEFSDDAIRHFIRIIFDPNSPVEKNLTEVILVA